MSRNRPKAVVAGMPCSTAQTSDQVVGAKYGSAQPSRKTASPRPPTTWSNRAHVNVGFGGAAGSAAGSDTPTSAEDVMRHSRSGRPRRVDVPLPAEHQVEHRTRYAQEGRQRPVGPAVRGGLGGVRAHRCSLLRGIPTDAYPVGD